VEQAALFKDSSRSVWTPLSDIGFGSLMLLYVAQKLDVILVGPFPLGLLHDSVIPACSARALPSRCWHHSSKEGTS